MVEMTFTTKQNNLFRVHVLRSHKEKGANSLEKDQRKNLDLFSFCMCDAATCEAGLFLLKSLRTLVLYRRV